jgi:CheY-like chemotaxis protein
MRQVLIVDDDDDIRETVRWILEDAGYAVEEAGHGAAALAQLGNTAQRMVVLLDVVMPETGGTDVLQQVATDETLAQHAFILMTAVPPSRFSPELNQLLATLSVPVITKPFDVDSLLRTVEQTAERL